MTPCRHIEVSRKKYTIRPSLMVYAGVNGLRNG